jgi:hypothetical protein
MLLRPTGAFASGLFGTALFLAACAPPEPTTLRSSGSANGSALRLGGKDEASDDDDSSSACAPAATGPDGTGPKDFACAQTSAAPAAPAAAAVANTPAQPAPAAPIQASLAVTRHPDGASMNNCLKIQVNGGPLVDLGCNHGSIVPNVTVSALPKPACNVVRLILFSNGQLNRTTQSAENIARDFLISQVGDNAFAIQCNDNGDDDFNDLNLDIASADANLTIENTGLGCTP